MISTFDYIYINAAAKDVFTIIYEYEKWPEFLTVNKKVVLIKTEGNIKQYEVYHQQSKKKLSKSYCKREILNNNHLKFELENKNFKFLRGEWIVVPLEKNVMLISIHEFELKLPVVLSFLKEFLEFFIVKKGFFDKTTPLTLLEIKDRAEHITKSKD